MKDISRPLPIFVALARIKDTKNAVVEYLETVKFSKEDIETVKKNPCVILFDGLDELREPINIYDANELSKW